MLLRDALAESPSPSPEEEAIFYCGAAAVLTIIARYPDPATLLGVLQDLRTEINAQAQSWLPGCLGVGIH